MKSKIKLSRLLAILFLYCLGFATGHEIKFPSQYIRCNENDLSEISNEVRSIVVEIARKKKIYDIKLENVIVQFIQDAELVQDTRSFPVMEQVFVSVTGTSCAEAARNRLDGILQDYIRIRLNGFTPAFATACIASDEGIEWSGFKVPGRILSPGPVLLPVWFSELVHLRDGSTVKFLDDGHIRRYLVIENNSVEAEFSLDVRDVTCNVLWSEAKQAAFSAVKRNAGEADKVYFLRISKWLREKRQISWISPYEIPSLGQF